MSKKKLLYVAPHLSTGGQPQYLYKQVKEFIKDFEIEVEYQGETIGKYNLDFDGTNFLLTTKQTDCLAKNNCGIPAEKPKVKLSELQETNTSCCSPSTGCC